MAENATEILETPMFKCELNTLSRADGSCIYSQDDTVVATAVYGPVEVKQHKMHIDKAHVEILFRPKCGASQLEDRLCESIISRICETAIITSAYPRTAIYVIIQEMQNEGSLLASTINATCLALIHAGISMNFLFAAVTCAIPQEDEDIQFKEGTSEECSLTFVFENTSSKILAIDSHGKFTDEQYKSCLEVCKRSSEVIFTFYKDMIKKYATKM
ncbi:exosome complex component RRP46 [Planococcus citri]|uniref:exosome complex component RRP46 n=1 Tax=Planococcus citri TaxID=170843 RepID=UPI0031F92486